jgi:hypothetical protein
VSEVAALPPALSSEERAPGWRETVVLCVAGRGSLDEAAAAMLAQLLAKHGIGARVVPSEAVSVANVMRFDAAGVQMAFLANLNRAASPIPATWSGGCSAGRHRRQLLSGSGR